MTWIEVSVGTLQARGRAQRRGDTHKWKFRARRQSMHMGASLCIFPAGPSCLCFCNVQSHLAAFAFCCISAFWSSWSLHGPSLFLGSLSYPLSPNTHSCLPLQDTSNSLFVCSVSASLYLLLQAGLQSNITCMRLGIESSGNTLECHAYGPGFKLQCTKQTRNK